MENSHSGKNSNPGSNEQHLDSSLSKGANCAVNIQKTEDLNFQMTYSSLADNESDEEDLGYTACAVLLNEYGNDLGTVKAESDHDITINLRDVDEKVKAVVITASSVTAAPPPPLRRIRSSFPPLCLEHDDLGEEAAAAAAPRTGGRMVTRVRPVERQGAPSSASGGVGDDSPDDQFADLERQILDCVSSQTISEEEGNSLRRLLEQNNYDVVTHTLELIQHLRAKALLESPSRVLELKFDMHHLPPESSEIGVTMIMCILYRKAAGWRIVEIGHAYRGSHYCCCLREIRALAYPLLENQLIQKASASFGRTKQLSIGEAVILPKKIKKLKVGLGWTIPDAFLDIDGSAVLFDRSLKKIDVVNWGSKGDSSIFHGGEDLLGIGAGGDDEKIVINFSRLDTKIRFIVFVVNIYTENRSFREVRHCHLRLLDPKTNHVFAYYKLHRKILSRGAILCVLEREQEGWRMQPLGKESKGKKASDVACENSIREVLNFPAPQEPDSENTDLGCRPVCVVS